MYRASISPNTYMMWCLIKYRENFAFLFLNFICLTAFSVQSFLHPIPTSHLCWSLVLLLILYYMCLCSIVGGYIAASHYRCPRQIIWDLWWKMWQWIYLFWVFCAFLLPFTILQSLSIIVHKLCSRSDWSVCYHNIHLQFGALCFYLALCWTQE
jgi:hypothetical protein